MTEKNSWERLLLTAVGAVNIPDAVLSNGRRPDRHSVPVAEIFGAKEREMIREKSV